MNELFKRSIFGAIFAAVVIGSLFLGPYGLLALLITISSIGLYEFLKLRKQNTPLFFMGVFIPNILFFISISPNFHLNYQAIFIALAAIFILCFILLVLYKNAINAFTPIAEYLFAFAYISLPLLLFYTYSNSSESYNVFKPLMVFLLVWSSDTFAYLTGRAFGKTPLFETLSPKKTIEGFIGGVLLTSILGAFLCSIWQISNPISGIALGLFIGVFGTAGDLFQSSLKRNAGVKDSGNIIPGHGGVLDRFDAFFFACFVVWIWSILQQYV